MKHLKHLFTALLLLCSTAVAAHDFEVGGVYYNILSGVDKTVEVTSGTNKYTGSVAIPESVVYGGITYSVTSIGQSAFYACDGLQTVLLPNSIVSIKSGAFAHSGINSITIPASVVGDIDGYMFYECSSLNEIVVDENNEVYDSREGCNAIVKTADNEIIVGSNNSTIPAGIVSISELAFDSREGLKELILPSGFKTIGERAFRDCLGLKKVYISETVTSVGAGAFGLCPEIESIVVDKNNKVLDSREDCNAIINTSTNTLLVGCQNTFIPGTITAIGSYAFFHAKNLEFILIPSSVTSLGDYAFYGCSSLKCMASMATTAPSLGQYSLGDGFAYLPGTLYVLNPDAYSAWKPYFTTQIGSYGDCGDNLFSCIISDVLHIWGTGNMDDMSYDWDDYYSNSAPWFNSGEQRKFSSIKIHHGVKSIGEGAFYGCTDFKSIEIPNSVTSIGGSAFSDCTGLTSIEIPNSVTSIGGAAFEGCDGLTSVEIPNSVTSIGMGAFWGCSGLTSIEIPNSVTSIGERAFNFCESLYSVKISDISAWCNISFGSSDANPLYYAKNLYLNGDLVSELVIPDQVTEIKNYAFYGCTGLKSIEIPNSVTSIGGSAFFGCTGLRTVYNNSSLNITVGSSNYGYVALYAAAVVSKSDILDKVGDFTFYINDSTVTLMEYSGGDNVISLPESYNGQNYIIAKTLFCNKSNITSVAIPNSVTSIGDSAFKGCTGLTSVVIGNGVTSIGNQAFYNCTGLTSVVIGDGVTSIGNQAFYNCTGLTSVEIPNSVTSIGNSAFERCTGLTSVTIGNSVTSIGGSAFEGCTGLTSIEIPNSVTSIGGGAFEGCTGLTSVVIGNGVTSIGDSAFKGCTGLTSVVIGDGVTSIGGFAFYGCTGLTSIEISNSVTSIGQYAFSGCTGLISIVIPNSVTSIGGSAFEDCSGLTSVTIGNSVTSIGSHAFDNCKGLTSIEIPNSVKSIAHYAFSACTRLTSVVIGDGVTSIGSDAFNACTGLTSVTSHIPADALFALNTNVFYGVDKNSCTLYVPYGAKETYAAKSGWSRFANIVELIPENALHGTCGADATWILIDGVLTIKGSGGIESNPWIDYAGEIQSIIIEDGITSICNDAFHGCSALTSITIPGSVTSIGSYALTSCTKLTSLRIPGSVTSIGESAFSGCWELSELSVDAANKVYDSRENCNAVIETATNTLVAGCKNTTIPVGVTGIGDNAFRGCVNLENIDIPASVTSIGVRSFSGCGKLANVTVPGSVTSIGDNAFHSCTGLTSIVIPNSVTSIGDWAFYSCTGLTSIEIPNSVTSIGDWAFNNCTGLKEVHINDLAAWYNISFGSSGANPLYCAKNLYLNGDLVSELVIPDQVTEIKNYAFYGCTGLTSVVIPNSVTHIGEDAFCKCSNLASVQISESLTTIETGVFSRTGLVNVTIPEGVISIGTWAFDNCPALVNVELPSTLTYIGKYAFENDTHLTSIEIPSSVTSIGGSAFNGCTGLTSITSHIPADALFAVNTNVFNGVDKNSCTLYVSYGAKETYAAKSGWSAFANIVELTPTEVTVNINQYGCATYCSPFALDFSEVEGLKAYAATGYKSNSQVVTLTRVQTAASGIGLFLKGEPGEYLVPVIESTDEHSLNMLVGTLEQTTVNSTDGAMSNYKFTIADGDAAPMFYPFEDGTTLSAGKAYLQIPTAWLPVTAQKSLSVRFDDGETTDIDEVKGEDGEVKGVCYDMQGRVVENPTSGIYIIDGKKVFIK